MQDYWKGDSYEKKSWWWWWWSGVGQLALFVTFRFRFMALNSYFVFLLSGWIGTPKTTYKKLLRNLRVTFFSRHFKQMRLNPYWTKGIWTNWWVTSTNLVPIGRVCSETSQIIQILTADFGDLLSVAHCIDAGLNLNMFCWPPGKTTLQPLELFIAPNKKYYWKDWFHTIFSRFFDPHIYFKSLGRYLRRWNRSLEWQLAFPNLDLGPQSSQVEFCAFTLAYSDTPAITVCDGWYWRCQSYNSCCNIRNHAFFQQTFNWWY